MTANISDLHHYLTHASLDLDSDDTLYGKWLRSKVVAALQSDSIVVVADAAEALEQYNDLRRAGGTA